MLHDLAVAYIDIFCRNLHHPSQPLPLHHKLHHLLPDKFPIQQIARPQATAEIPKWILAHQILLVNLLLLPLHLYVQVNRNLMQLKHPNINPLLP